MFVIDDLARIIVLVSKQVDFTKHVVEVRVSKQYVIRGEVGEFEVPVAPPDMQRLGK